jgi:ABC-2 type transport system ATP-binding protein
VICGGRIVATGTPADLKGRIADRTIVEIEAFGASDAMIERLRSVAGVASVSVELREQAQVILVQSSHGPELVQPLLRELMIGLAYIGAGILLLRLLEFESRRTASLETM